MTDRQSVSAQVEGLSAAGAETVLRGMTSGAKSDRVQLARMLRKPDTGGLVVVTRPRVVLVEPVRVRR